MSSSLRIAVAGARGRMGRAVVAAVEADPGLTLAARFGRPGTVGKGLVSAAEALATADIVIDFSTAEASTALAAQAADQGVALVIASTGFSPEQLRLIKAASAHTPIVRSASFALGVNLLLAFVNQAARALPADAYDIEIAEAHHHRKIDAPSGTALMFGEAAAAGRGVDLSKVARRTRDGVIGERPFGEIGISVIRSRGFIAEHTISFGADTEILTFSHSARDRSLYARGAVAAARWVAGRPPGEYDMQDVLGLKG